MCFRHHWPGGSTLSDSHSELQTLMSAQQESGHLVTGFRRWKMRQSSRSTLELGDGEKWTCPRGCGQLYRVSSTRSIQKHTITCKRPTSQESAEGRDYCTDEPPTESSFALAVDNDPKQGEESRISQSECKLERPIARRGIPGQFDGFEEEQLGQKMEESDMALHYESGGIDSSPTHTLPASSLTSTLDWENTPLRRLLRRQQLETDHLSAQHFMEAAALRDEPATALDISARPLGVQVWYAPSHFTMAPPSSYSPPPFPHH